MLLHYQSEWSEGGIRRRCFGLHLVEDGRDLIDGGGTPEGAGHAGRRRFQHPLHVAGSLGAREGLVAFVLGVRIPAVHPSDLRATQECDRQARLVAELLEFRDHLVEHRIELRGESFGFRGGPCEHLPEQRLDLGDPVTAVCHDRERLVEHGYRLNGVITVDQRPS